MTKNKEKIFSESECLSLDAILRYLHDQSSLQERHKVEKHMLECELCHEAVEGYALMEEKNRAAGIMADLNKGFSKTLNTFFDIRRVAAGVAAVLVLGGGLFYLNTNLDTVNDSVAVQKEESQTDSLKYKNPSKQAAPDAGGPIVLENAKPQDPAVKKNTTAKSYEYNSDGEIVIENEGSGTYMWEKGIQVPSAASLPKEEAKKEPTGVIADTISLKNQIAYDYSMPASEVSESDKKLLKEEEIKVDRKKEDRVKSKSRAAYHAPSAEKMTDLKSAPAMPDNMDIGIQRYQEKKYAEASVVFEKIIKSDPNNFKALYYNGLSYFELEKWDKAIENFDLISKGQEFYDDAQWKKAMVLKKSNRVGAKEILEEMAGREGPYKQKALEELRILDK